MRWYPTVIGALFFLILSQIAVYGQTADGQTSPLSLSLNLEGADEARGIGVAIQIVALMTILTMAPAIVMLMTSFTRIVIVLSFVRTALGVQQAPSNQIIIGIALFMTLFIMAPVWNQVNDEALRPYMDERIDAEEAFANAVDPLKAFMLRQTRPNDVELFLNMAGMGPTSAADLPMHVVIPAFVISELRTAFQMGFLIFIPFIVIDFIVASTLMAMGMVMMPPVIVSLPFKLLLFVLVDGWYLLIKSLVQSFGL